MVSGDDSQPALHLRTQAFLQEFFAKGQQLVRDLIEENERLRARSSMGAECEETDARVAQLTAQIERLEAECAAIRKRTAPPEYASPGYRSRLEALEQEHYQLAVMYVAGKQLHASTTLEEVVRTVTEILLNFVGVGHFTIYAVDEPRNVLFRLHHVGGTESAVPEVVDLHGLALPEAPLDRASATSLPPTLLADGLLELPLRSGSRLIGLVHLQAFLPQKSSFVDSDLALLEIVAETTGLCLESAWIRAHATNVPLTQEGFEEFLVA